MRKRSEPQRWAARERLAFIEMLAFWRGWFRRADLMERFNISEPHASADIAAYLKLNPRALRYDKSLKRYCGASNMVPKLITPRFADAVAMQGGNGVLPMDGVALVDLPSRVESPAVIRPIVQAVGAGEAIEIEYYSVNSGSADWRWICPRAFAHDGYRWHVRAWCMESKCYKDFVFGRIAATRARKAAGILPRDVEWEEFTTVRFRPHPALTPMQKEAIERDFGMKKGIGVLQVRKAMLFYTLLYLGLESDRHPFARRLELEKFNR